ncbi:patatin-like phospholipase family protein [Uliginosibacterium sp. sgz301328]|uniref:patatin-like phospholipase family protein n=1 Tax=Uliginosibacterium sp. sgz301328 TaxID=3243764 RepID=UPI00359D4C81
MPFLARCCATFAVFLSSIVCAQAQEASQPAPRPRVGLVLGGGGARGLAHLGVLEELRRLDVPIDCIAGTSAGALIGGIYASGMDVPEMVERIENADWDLLLSGTPNRRDIPYERKVDDFTNYASFTLGIDAQGVKIPRSVIGSQAIDRFLHQLTRDVNVGSFHELPIPFEAVATDLGTGEMKVFASGDLALALRASMAVPGIFDAVSVGDQLLVDGMFVRNLPVENVKSQCNADVVIAVDVGRPMKKVDQIHSLVDVVGQAMQIATGQNVREQRALLGPRDIIIEPQLEEYSPSSFRDVKAIVQRGRESVAGVEPQLRALSVGDAEYAKWRIALDRKLGDPARPYDRIEVAGTRFVPEENIAAALGGRDQPSNQQALQGRLDQLYDTGDFDRLNYFVRDEDGQRVATVTPVERAVGPNYLRFGLDIRLDTHQASDIALLGNLQMTWLNRWGAQWRTSARLGLDSNVSTEFLQPLAKSPVFVAANASVSSRTLGIYDQDGSRLFDVGFWERMLGLDLGYSLGSLGEVRLGYFSQHLRSKITTGFIQVLLGEDSVSSTRANGVRASFVMDQMDNPRFPRRGYLVRLDYLNGSEKSSDGSEGRFQRAEGDFDWAHTYGGLTTIRTTLRGRASSSRLPGSDDSTNADNQIYTLGGFLQLSGLQTNQLAGGKTALARVMAYRQIAPLLPTFGSGTYAGFSLEAGRMWNMISLTDKNETAWIPAASAYLGVDTLLGPLYLALGWANYHGGAVGAYLYLGYTK